MAGLRTETRPWFAVVLRRLQKDPMKASQPAAISLVPLKDHAQDDKVPGKAALILIVLLILCGSSAAVAQDMPRVQIFGGYSYTRFDSPSFGFANPSNLNGYTFSPAMPERWCGWPTRRATRRGQWCSEGAWIGISLPALRFGFFRLITFTPRCLRTGKTTCDFRPVWCTAGARFGRKGTGRPHKIRNGPGITPQVWKELDETESKGGLAGSHLRTGMGAGLAG